MSKRKRVRAFTKLLYAVAEIEVVLAVVSVIDGRGASGLIWLLAAAVTAALARTLWAGFEQRGGDDWRYSWRALYRKLRG